MKYYEFWYVRMTSEPVGMKSKKVDLPERINVEMFEGSLVTALGSGLLQASSLARSHHVEVDMSRFFYRVSQNTACLISRRIL